MTLMLARRLPAARTSLLISRSKTLKPFLGFTYARYYSSSADLDAIYNDFNSSVNKSSGNSRNTGKFKNKGKSSQNNADSSSNTNLPNKKRNDGVELIDRGSLRPFDIDNEISNNSSKTLFEDLDKIQSSQNNQSNNKKENNKHDKDHENSGSRVDKKEKSSDSLHKNNNHNNISHERNDRRPPRNKTNDRFKGIRAGDKPRGKNFKDQRKNVGNGSSDLDKKNNFFEKLTDLTNEKKMELAMAKSAKPSYNDIEFSITLDPKSFPLQKIEPSIPQDETPRLEHDLDRVLFSPGVHTIKDLRTNVYNFPPHLENIISIREFDFQNVPTFVPSAQDTVLADLTASQKLKYSTSTSSLTSVLTQLHFLISRFRPPNSSMLSNNFRNENTDFSYTAKKPVSVFLRWNPKTKTYALDADKSQDEEIILSLLGQVLEAKLTVPHHEFETFVKPLDESKPAPPAQPPKNVYHYSSCGDFALRSQIDCYDPRLPGTGVFDVKTRAVCAIRHDIGYAQIKEGSDYQIRKMNGQFESYEREHYDLIRSALFKYSLQARIGRMDGIFVAYHNIRKFFGFEYLPLEEIDQIYHSPRSYNATPSSSDQHDIACSIAEREFQISIGLLSKILNEVTAKYPEQSVNLLFRAPTSYQDVEAIGSGMVVMAHAMPDTVIDNIQNGLPVVPIKSESVPKNSKKGKSDGRNREEKLIKHNREQLETKTLVNLYEEKYYGKMFDTIGWVVNLVNHVDGTKMPVNKSPDPLPTEDWTATAEFAPIPDTQLGMMLQSILANTAYEKDARAAAIDASADSPPVSKGRTVAPVDTTRRSKEEIEAIVVEQLKKLGKPSELESTLRALDEKGHLHLLEHEKKFGGKKKIVWTSSSSSSA